VYNHDRQAAEAKLGRQVIDTFEGKLEFNDYPDQYQAELRK